MAKRSSYGDLEKIEKHPNYFKNPISGIIYFRKSIQGSPVKISSGVTSISEARKIIDNKLIEMFSANPQMEKRARRGNRNPLLKDLWSDLMAERKPQKHANTMTTYGVSWNHGIKAFWGHKTALAITQKNVTEFENWYLENYPERTFFNTRKHLNMLFKFCEGLNLLKCARPKIRDLDEVINTKIQRKKVGRVYTGSEMAAILLNASPRTRIGLCFARFMGMRKMEFLSMKLDQLDLKAETAKVWSAKNKHWRTVPIPSFFLKELSAYRETLSKDATYLFPSSHESATHISSQIFDKDWVRAKRLAKIKDWDVENGARIHDFRHTFATQTAVEGWAPAVACSVLDMSLDEYQRTYVHVVSFDIKKAMDKSFNAPEVKD